MKIIKTSLNFLLTSFIFFIIFSVWAHFYIKNNALATILSLLFSMLAFLIIRSFLSKKEKTAQIKSEKLKELDKFKIYFHALGKDEFFDLLKKIYAEKVENKNGHVVLSQSVLVINAQNKTISKNDLFCFCKQAKELLLNKIAILNFEYSEKIILFAKTISNFEIEFISDEKMFDLAQKSNIGYENIITFKNKTKFTFKMLLSLIFARKNAKLFLFFGILNYISSYLTIFKFYYYISTTIFLLLGLICLFRPKESTSQSLLD